jgi:hypothetical protein
MAPRGGVSSARRSTRGLPTASAPARCRPAAAHPRGAQGGRGSVRGRPAPEAWLALPVPARSSAATCAAAHAPVARHTPMARRHTTPQASCRRGVGRCGPGHLACPGRPRPPGSPDARCRGRTEALRAAPGARCTARLTPARARDALGGQARGRIRRAPALRTPARARAHGGAGRPQALPARRPTRRDALLPLARQHARLRAVARAALLGRDACARTRLAVTPTPPGLTQPRRPLAAQAQPPVHQLTWAHRRHLVERLLDHVLVPRTRWPCALWGPRGPRGKSPRWVIGV